MTDSKLGQSCFDREMHRFQDRTGGLLGVMIRDFSTGADLIWNASEAFPTASTMKVPLLYALYLLAQEGDIDLDARVDLLPHHRVPGSGVLQHMDAGLRPTVRDLAELMTIVSDNAATDMLYRLIGRERLAGVLGKIELSQTQLPHSIWQMLAHVSGLDGDDPELTYDTLRQRLKASASEDPEAPYVTDAYDRSTPADMIRLLTLIEDGTGLTPESRSAVIDTLKHQTVNDRIPARLPDDAGIEVAHKTGSLRGVRNDVGIVYAPGVRYAIAIMSRNLPDTAEAVDQIAHLSRWVWDRLSASAS